LLEFDLSAAHAVSARFADFRLTWDDWAGAWSRYTTKNFPDEFIAWHATLPADLEVELSPNLAGLLGAPLRAQVDFSALPAEGSGRDWFDLTVALRVEDTMLGADEIALLLKARGKWVRLPTHGWRRLELASAGAVGDAADALERLGLGAAGPARHAGGVSPAVSRRRPRGSFPPPPACTTFPVTPHQGAGRARSAAANRG
jgi:hypothetical protein